MEDTNEHLAYVRKTQNNEQGEVTVVIDGLPLLVGFVDQEQALMFCKRILGASAFSYHEDMIVCTRFEFQKKYRVPNAFSLDEHVRKYD